MFSYQSHGPHPQTNYRRVQTTQSFVVQPGQRVNVNQNGNPVVTVYNFVSPSQNLHTAPGLSYGTQQHQVQNPFPLLQHFQPPQPQFQNHQQLPFQTYQQLPFQTYQQLPFQNHQQLPFQNHQQLPFQNYQQPQFPNHQQAQHRPQNQQQVHSQQQGSQSHPQQPVPASVPQATWKSNDGKRKISPFNEKFKSLFSKSPKTVSPWREELGIGHLSGKENESLKKSANLDLSRFTSSRNQMDKLKGELQTHYGVDFDTVKSKDARAALRNRAEEDIRLSDGTSARDFAKLVLDRRDSHHSGTERYLREPHFNDYSLPDLESAKRTIAGSRNPMLSPAEHQKVRAMEKTIDQQMARKIMEVDIKRDQIPRRLARQYAKHLDMAVQNNIDPQLTPQFQAKKAELEKVPYDWITAVLRPLRG
jgi:hypothetical protein